jgi:hypothetical protein
MGSRSTGVTYCREVAHFRAKIRRQDLQIVNRLAGQNAVVREVPAFEHDIRFHRLLGARPDSVWTA